MSKEIKIREDMENIHLSKKTVLCLRTLDRRGEERKQPPNTQYQSITMMTVTMFQVLEK